jgi:hypothetical protein
MVLIMVKRDLAAPLFFQVKQEETTLVHNGPKQTPAHEQTQNINKRTRHNTPPTSTTWERRSKQAADTCVVVINDVSQRSRNLLQA